MNDMEWIRTIERESGFRRCLILYGNVRDLWPSTNGNQLRLADLLVNKLSDRFSLQGTWDAIDGLRFPKQSHLTLFNDMMEQNAPSEDGDEYDDISSSERQLGSDVRCHERQLGARVCIEKGS